jgi:Zn-dependent peptidase ImmA (M78 family)/transcriptional regulator with XRE-family HTH domain
MPERRITKKASIGNLLRSERIKLGYSLKDVAQFMQYNNYQTLSSIESDTRELKAWELSKLASIYKKPINFFTEMKDVTEEPRVLWRKSFESVGQVKIERDFLAYCNNYKRLLELTNETNDFIESLPIRRPDKQKLKQSGYSYVEEIADECHRILNLGAKPAYSLVNILENSLGVKVFFIDLGGWGSAASTVHRAGAAILINSSEAPWRRNYNLAHELFHLITWNLFSEQEIYSAGSEKSDIEKWADAFASALLLPVDELRKEFNKRLEGNRISFISLVEIAREFCVSIEALLWRLTKIGLLKRRDVIECLEKGEIKDIDKKSRIQDWEEKQVYISERYISLAIKAYKMEKISKSKFAEYVNIPFSKVSSFLKRYGYDEDKDYSFEFSTS